MMPINAPQRGFLLPIMVVVLVGFSLWIVQHTSTPQPSLLKLREVLRYQQQLWFWQQAVMHYHRQEQQWPTDLAAVAARFQLTPADQSLSLQSSTVGITLKLGPLDKALLSPIALSIKPYVSIDQQFLLLPLQEEVAAGFNPRWLARYQEPAVTMATELRLPAWAALLSAGVDSNTAQFEDFKALNISVSNSRAEQATVAQLNADEVWVQGRALSQQWLTLQSLYDALWHCMYVSEHCQRSYAEI